MRIAVLLCTILGVVAQQPSDGSNLETFPSIIDDLSSSSTRSSFPSPSYTNTPFNPTTFLTAPGPALPPSSYVTGGSTSAPAPTGGVVSRTLISASYAASSSSARNSSSSTTGTPSESVVTSTVDGSVATVTITNSAEPANAAGRPIVRATGVAWALAGTIGAIVLGGTLAVC
ncbi:hypothetical protein JCM11251_003093 [Rhodosporidiobolus azoricus]